jgi:hypothetical protein
MYIQVKPVAAWDHALDPKRDIPLSSLRRVMIELV